MFAKALILLFVLSFLVCCSRKGEVSPAAASSVTPPALTPTVPKPPVSWQNGLAEQGNTTLLFEPKNFGEHPMGGSALEQRDGKFLIELISYPESPLEPKLVVYRFNVDGTADLEYGEQGFIHLVSPGCGDYGHAATLDSQDRLVLASVVRQENGGKTTVTAQVARFTSSGQLDKTYGDQGITRVASDYFKTKIQNPAHIQSPENLLISSVPNSNRIMIALSHDMNQYVALSLDDQGKLAHILEVPTVATPSKLTAMAAISETKLVAYFDNSYYQQEWKRRYSFAKVNFVSPETKVVMSQMTEPWHLVKLFHRDRKIYGAGDIALKETLIVTRFDEEMISDGGFGEGGVVTRVWEKQPDAYHPLDATSAAMKKDGTLLVVGRGNFRTGTSLMKVTADGKLDQTFLPTERGHTLFPEGGAMGVLALSSGKTLLTGQSATKPEQTALYWW